MKDEVGVACSEHYPGISHYHTENKFVSPTEKYNIVYIRNIVRPRTTVFPYVDADNETVTKK